ncbi:hypothetical protein MOOR_27990 [Moorella thermoacetica]|uniref:Uncharacterized protein n=1 Tax=Neomoorella thermoacetica TaxID=1525 RepID=A0A1J5JVH9_NEOTH|nr:hypothetical protein MOOR_27990 [Moorella thermoacetica]
MSITFVQGPDAGVDYVPGGSEIGFADFQVDDLLALGFQSFGLGQDHKGRFGPQIGHFVGKDFFEHGLSPPKITIWCPL